MRPRDTVCAPTELTCDELTLSFMPTGLQCMCVPERGLGAALLQTKVMLDERDDNMFRRLLECKGKVVAVVGLRHLDGIEARWRAYSAGRSTASLDTDASSHNSRS